MNFRSRTGAGAATLALVLLGAVICRCPVPMPMASAPSEHAHHHDCCPEEPSVRAVSDDCCANLPEVNTAILRNAKNERQDFVLAVAAADLAPAPTVEVRSDRPFRIPLPPASPPLVLRI